MGALIIRGITLLVAMIWFLTGSEIVRGTAFESNFSEPVQGLEIGASVKYCGVGGDQPLNVANLTYRLVFVR